MSTDTLPTGTITCPNPACHEPTHPDDTYCAACGALVCVVIVTDSSGNPIESDPFETTHEEPVTMTTTTPATIAAPDTITATDMVITAPLAICTLADKYTSKDQSRPVLTGVCLLPHQGIAAATDGFAMGTVKLTVSHLCDASPKQVLIDHDTLKMVKKLHTDKDHDLTIMCNDDGKWHIDCRVKGGGIMPVWFTPMEGTYPDVMQIMPRQDKTDTITAGVYLNPKYLKAIADLAIANGDDHVWIGSRSNGEGIEGSTDHGIRTYTMPLMRQDSAYPTAGTSRN